MAPTVPAGSASGVRRVPPLADHLLFAFALDVDRAGAVPPSHWDQLAAEGMYGLAAPPDAGGPGLAFPQIIEILETMAGGCLTTTFTGSSTTAW